MQGAGSVADRCRHDVGRRHLLRFFERHLPVVAGQPLEDAIGVGAQFLARQPAVAIGIGGPEKAFRHGEGDGGREALAAQPGGIFLQRERAVAVGVDLPELCLSEAACSS